MLIYGFTGTRHGMTPEQSAVFRRELGHGPGEFHHGGARGADATAHAIAFQHGWTPHVHPASRVETAVLWSYCGTLQAVFYDPLPPLIRNRKIVQACTLLFAAPAGLEILRSGTWATVRYARKIGRPIILIYPDGRIEVSSEVRNGAALRSGMLCG